MKTRFVLGLVAAVVLMTQLAPHAFAATESAIASFASSDVIITQSTTTGLTGQSFTLTGEGSAKIKKDVTKGTLQLDKGTYKWLLEVYGEVKSTDVKKRKVTNVSGTLFIYDSTGLVLLEEVDLTKAKITIDKKAKQFKVSAKQVTGTFKFKNAVDLEDIQFQTGKGTKISKIAVDKAKFSSIKTTASMIE